MTEISYTDYYDTHIIECTGHTNYAPMGADILCSAVSSLCLAAKEYLCAALSDGVIKRLSCELRSGDALIVFDCDDDSRALQGIEAIVCGFRFLAEIFPEHISFAE